MLTWIFVSTTLALITIPSVTLLKNWQSTRRFLAGIGPGVIRQTRTTMVPHRERPPLEEPRLRFVEFSLKAPRARSVSVTGDFSGWKQDALPLTRSKDGSWQIVVPLPEGRFHYHFIVDGKATPDPAAGDPVIPPGGGKGTVPSVASFRVVQ